MKKDILEVVMENENLIYKIANKFYNVDRDDLYQAGVMGIIKAYQNFHEESAKFSTYAYNYIFGEMYDLVKNDRNIKLNKEYLKLYKSICKAKECLTQKLNREPSLFEVSLFLELDEKLIEEVILMSEQIISLDNEINEMSLYEKIADKESMSLTDKMTIKDSLNTLNNIEKDIINYRYYQDYSQSETAKKMGLTQVMVSRYETKSKEKIKRYMLN